MKKTISILLLVAMVLALMAGCGKTEEAPAAAPAAQEAPAAAISAPAKIEEPAPEGGITRGGTLVVAKQKAMDKGLDITKDSDCSSAFTAMATIYECLFAFDEGGNPAPCLATEWTWAADGLSLEVKLRDDVSFSNGEKFNAEAVAKCMNYYLTEECAHVFKSSDLSCIEKVDVVDEYTVNIVLSAPDAGLCAELASCSGMIAAPAVVDAKFACDPIGTGAYVLDEYKEGEYLSVKANPNYYRMGEDGQPLPYLDGIKFLFVTDDTTAITNLKAGSVNGIDRLSSSSSTFTAQGMDTVNLLQNPVTQCYNITFNLLDETLKNDKLREAIVCAINSDEILEIAMEGLGANTGFWTDEAKWFYNDYNPAAYDLEKAKSLMAEAGYANGLNLELAIISREPDNTVAQLVQAQLAEIGINVTISAMDSASWVAYVRTDHKEQLAISLAGNAGYEPSKGWTVILKSFGDVGTGLDMVDHLNELVMATKSETDSAKRNAMIDEYQRTILDNNLTAVIGHKYQYGAFQTSVHGVNFHFYGWLEFTNAWMDA